MELGDIIDKLVEGETVTLEAVMPDRKESMRVVLTEKFRRYVELMDSVGYLPDEVQGKTISFSYDKYTQQLSMVLKKRRGRIEYKVLGHES